MISCSLFFGLEMYFIVWRNSVLITPRLTFTNIREFKNPWRRCRWLRQLKNEVIFTYESCGTLKSFTLFISVKAIMKLSLRHIDISKIKIRKISHRGSRSLDNPELGHFTFLFCRGWQRNVQRITTDVHSYCSAH